MTNTKKQDLEHAEAILNGYAEDFKDGSALLLISQDYGKGLTDYLRVSVASYKDGKVEAGYLTWAVAKVFGYSLRNRYGAHYLGISGYGYSKADEIARTVARFYGLDRVRYELN